MSKPVSQRRVHSRAVVCGVDPSEHSHHALRVAANLAQRLDSDLVLVTVRPSPANLPSGMAGEVSAAREQAVEAGRRVLAEVGDVLRESRVIDRVRARVEFGKPVTRLAAVADELDAALIVVGARGRGSAGSLLGSVSHSLAADPSRPVLVVPPRWSPPAPGAARRAGAEPSIVCGVDGSSAAMRAARVAGTLASGLGLRFVPVHVDDGAGAAAADLAPSAEGHLVRGSPASALAEVAGVESAEMIAVGTRGHGGLKALVLGSVSRALLASASRPVLVVNDGPADAH